MTAARPAVTAVAVVPALVLVTSGLLQTATGAEVVAPPGWLIHPALVLGGLAAALALAATDALRLGIERGADATAVRLILRHRPLSLGVLALSTALAAVIGLYLVAENLLHP